MNALQKVIRYLIKEVKKTVRHKEQTLLIALYPNAETISNIVAYRDKIQKMHDLSSMQEILPEELHATVRWWEAKHGNFHKIAADLGFFEFEKPIQAKIIDTDVLGDSLSLMLNSVEMERLFDKVDNMVQGHGGPPSTYPSYNPHLALFYGDWDKIIIDQVTEAPDFPIVFDRIKMIDNSDNIYINKRIERKEK